MAVCTCDGTFQQRLTRKERFVDGTFQVYQICEGCGELVA
jgi:hypothetical protein